MNDKIGKNGKGSLNNIVWLPTCQSTNSFAKEFIRRQKAEAGWTVATYEQTRGRGQAGNSWEAEPYKNLTFSSVFYPENLAIEDLFFLNIGASLALTDYLENSGINALIKWPNDIYVESKKIAGILIEPVISTVEIKNCVIGIGLNVNQDVFKTTTAVSMFNILNQEVNLEVTLEGLVGRLKKRINSLNTETLPVIREEYYKKLLRKDKPAAYQAGERIFTGIIRETDRSGSLIIETETGIEKFEVKQLRFLF